MTARGVGWGRNLLGLPAPPAPGEDRTKVRELKPRMKVPSLELTVVEKGEVRNFTSREGLTGKVCDARGEDEEGQAVSISLWNEEIDKVQVNDRIRITNGWVSEWRGNLQVSAGRFGRLEVLK